MRKKKHIFELGGNTNLINSLYSSFGNNNSIDSSALASAIGAGASLIQDAIPSKNMSELDAAIYGNSSEDPIKRFIQDISGISTKNAINSINSNINYNTNIADNNTLMERFNNMPLYQRYNTTDGLGWKTALSTAVGAPWLDFQGDKVVFSTDNLMASAKGAAAGSSFGPWGALIGGIAGGVLNLGSRLGRNSRIKKINTAIDNANMMNMAAFNSSVNNSNTYSNNMFNAQFAALGGPLNSHGADYTQGLIEINNGGTHESNPLGGVPFGVAEDGQPNLVEEGEVVKDNFVFSNRIKIPKSIMDKYNFPSSIKTFADAMKKSNIVKEAEERPDSPLSKRALNQFTQEMAMFQESIKQEQSNNYSLGGILGHKYLLGGKETNFGNVGIPVYLLQDPDMYNIIPQPIEMEKTLPSISPRYDILEQVNIPTTKNISTKQNNNSTTPLSTKGKDLGRGLQALTTALSFKPVDYSNADKVDAVYSRINPYQGYKTLGDYVTYNPIDSRTILNRMAAQNNAATRALTNLANGNRASLMSAIVGNNYNYNNSIGDLYSKLAAQNEAQKLQVAQFNRGTNQANAQMDLHSKAMTNQALQAIAQGRLQTGNMRNALDIARSQAISQNLTNLTQGLYDDARQNFILNQLASAGYGYGYQDPTSGWIKYIQPSALGGKIKTKKK